MVAWDRSETNKQAMINNAATEEKLARRAGIAQATSVRDGGGGSTHVREHTKAPRSKKGENDGIGDVVVELHEHPRTHSKAPNEFWGAV